MARCEIVDWFHLLPVSSFVYNEIVEKTGGVTGRTRKMSFAMGYTMSDSNSTGICVKTYEKSIKKCYALHPVPIHPR